MEILVLFWKVVAQRRQLIRNYRLIDQANYKPRIDRSFGGTKPLKGKGASAESEVLISTGAAQ